MPRKIIKEEEIEREVVDMFEKAYRNCERVHNSQVMRDLRRGNYLTLRYKEYCECCGMETVYVLSPKDYKVTYGHG